MWDHLAFVWGVPAGEPWVILAAAAQATTRLRLGTAITPLARRWPQVLANTVATLDVLSQGRVVLREYAGAGVTWWLESLHGQRADRAALLARVRAGPPQGV